MERKVLIIGAAGIVTLEAAKILAARNFQVFVGVKNLTRAGLIEIPGVKYRYFDYTDPLTYISVFEDIKKVILVSPPAHLNLHELTIEVINQGVEAGIEQIVNISSLGIADSQNPMRQIERRIEELDIEYSIIRPNCFMQYFNIFFKNAIVSEDIITAPIGDFKTSFIDARDVAEVAAQLISRDNLENKTFSLTGGKALSMEEIASIFSKSLGRKITYKKIGEMEYLDYLERNGLTNMSGKHFICLCQYLNNSWNSIVTGDIGFLLNRNPSTFENYVSDYINEWQRESEEKNTIA